MHVQLFPVLCHTRVIPECHIYQQTSKPSESFTVQPPGLSVQQVLAFMIVLLETVCSVWAEIVGLLGELISRVLQVVRSQYHDGSSWFLSYYAAIV